MTPPAQRVAVIGLDSAEWTLVEGLLATGDLPHLAALRRRSAVAVLRNPDYRSGLVWEHFLTGRGPAGCGRRSAVEFDPATYEVWQQGARGMTPFYLTDPPLTSVLFDVPHVSLACEAPGLQVTSWGSHDGGYPRAARPMGLLREIEARFGPHPAFGNDYEIVWHRSQELAALADALIVGTRRRADISQWLLTREPDWELFMTVLSETHSAQEQFWHGVDEDHPVAPAGTVGLARRRLYDVYHAVDDTVGRIVAGLPEDAAVVVFSTNGAARASDVASMVLLPELLYRLHAGRPFLRHPEPSAWAAAGRPVVVPDPASYWTVQLSRDLPLPIRWRSWRYRVPAPLRAAYWAARNHLRPALRRGALGIPIPEETTAAPAEIGVPRASVDWAVPSWYRSEWPRMRAFALPTFIDGRVRINLIGRERDGVVPLADYDRTCEEIVEAVAACRDPRTGRPILAEARRPRAHDPLDPAGPDADLELWWSHATDAWEHPEAGTIGPFPYRRTGGHGPNGFAFLAGSHIAPVDLGAHSALDLAPTILALLGRRPVDGRLEGRSLLDACLVA
jgi:predicted AlkP superfamily phosphohydrolase/phosphomutase